MEAADVFKYKDIPGFPVSTGSRADEAPPPPPLPLMGIVCGSELGGLADIVEDADVFEYKDIPGFPIRTG